MGNGGNDRINWNGKENSMQTGKDVASKVRARRLGMMSAAALAASLGMLALGGCSSQEADKPPESPIAVNFQLDKCQQLEPNLYKCPAVDQPMCTPEFNRGNSIAAMLTAYASDPRAAYS